MSDISHITNQLCHIFKSAFHVVFHFVVKNRVVCTKYTGQISVHIHDLKTFFVKIYLKSFKNPVPCKKFPAFFLVRI